jgi:hypothetical protein
MASRPSGKMLKSPPPDPARHQNSALALTIAMTLSGGLQRCLLQRPAGWA